MESTTNVAATMEVNTRIKTSHLRRQYVIGLDCHFVIQYANNSGFMQSPAVETGTIQTEDTVIRVDTSINGEPTRDQRVMSILTMASLKIMATTRTTKEAAAVDHDPTRGCIPIRQDTAMARMDSHSIHTRNPSIISLQPLGRVEATLMPGAIRPTPVP